MAINETGHTFGSVPFTCLSIPALLFALFSLVFVGYKSMEMKYFRKDPTLPDYSLLPQPVALPADLRLAQSRISELENRLQEADNRCNRLETDMHTDRRAWYVERAEIRADLRTEQVDMRAERVNMWAERAEIWAAMERERVDMRAERDGMQAAMDRERAAMQVERVDMRAERAEMWAATERERMEMRAAREDEVHMARAEDARKASMLQEVAAEFRDIVVGLRVEQEEGHI